MPAHIPHTYRKPSGIYYFRYVFPQSICERFPSLGADIRFSLKTKSHAEAKLRVYQYVSIVNISIDIIEKYYYNARLGRSAIFRSVLLDRLYIDISDIALFTLNGDESCNSPHAVRKKDFYMLMEQVRHTHTDGSITTFNYSFEQNIEALALLKVKERFYSHRLLQQDRSIPTAIRSFETDAAIPDDLAMESFTSEESVGDLPDEVWDYMEQFDTEVHPDDADGFKMVAFGGKGGCFPQITYQLRKVYVVESEPVDQNHPISKREHYIDAQTFIIPRNITYDRKGDMWKSFTIGQAHPDHHLPVNKGTGVAIDDSFTMIDVQAQHCTTGQFKGIVDPELSPADKFTVQNMRASGN